MARELGMKPSSLAKLASNKDQPWKAPLAQFIEDQYFRRFKRDRPEHKIVWKPVKAAKPSKQPEEPASDAAGNATVDSNKNILSSNLTRPSKTGTPRPPYP